MTSKVHSLAEHTMHYLAWPVDRPENRSSVVSERGWMRGAAPLAVVTLLERREMYGYELVEALERDSMDSGTAVRRRGR